MILPTYHGHVGRLQSLLALLDVELHALSFIQVSEALPLDCGKVHKDVIALLSCYEPIALLSIEPLDGPSFSFRHVTPFKNVVRRKVSPSLCIERAPRLVKVWAHIIFDQTRVLLHPTMIEYHRRQVLSNFRKDMAQAVVSYRIILPE
jgi:hypothetical protein